MNEREKRKMKETMLRCHCETNTQHDPSMRVTDSGVGASETVRQKETRVSSVARLPSSSQDLSQSPRHADITSSHTHVPVGAGGETARGDGRQMQLAHWLPSPHNTPLVQFPPRPLTPRMVPWIHIYSVIVLSFVVLLRNLAD